MKTTAFLTFVGDNCGKAEEAIKFYTSIFPNSEILEIVKYKAGELGGTPELVKYGVFILNGTEYRVSENNYKHAWSFSPGISIFVQCTPEDDIESLFNSLVDGGQVMIPLGHYPEDNYGFGNMFGWCADKYGISWQLHLSE